MTARRNTGRARKRSFAGWIAAAGLAATVVAAPAKADAFKPGMFLQNGAALSAIALAVSHLNNCPEDLAFSQATKKEADGAVVTVTVTCKTFPGEDGKAAPASVQVEFELDDDGSVGLPLAFVYD